ncbi:hypothetical protein H6P81_000527 [Aristolochia fimbriata]|uniref:TsaA-like domain-containing protein n=1 Tax=Aristolochia fimbriata TaxID=158543 RepID=A0AAV7F5P7_ARIFI|nr:hypothetical protein H6P81_000527 [Aristolochia fimbriata]
MAAAAANSKWIALVVAGMSATAFVSAYILRKKWRTLGLRIRELEVSLKDSLEKLAAERQGRIRAQQAMRKTLVQQNCDQTQQRSYPMTPIGFVKSCFSTRNGTPRQPLLIPLARACLVLDSSRAPPEALEGLSEYSHCWILYVFHLNTDLEKLWKEPSRSKFKAKVRVPRLKGGKLGVLATRSPHRPCPIGLTVAKVEGVHGRFILLSGVDLVDGTPVLDVKPYLPYSDSIQEAKVPKWVTVDNALVVASVNFAPNFSPMLANCWVTAGKESLYASPDEFQTLIKQVLSWDIRSVSQRNRPHNTLLKQANHGRENLTVESELEHDEATTESDGLEATSVAVLDDVTYHLNLERLDVSYRINNSSNVMVEKATLSPAVEDTGRNYCNYTLWREILEEK